MIYSIADEPTDEIVGHFILDKLDMIIEATLPNQVPRLRETALFVTGLVIKNYPRMISHNADKSITDLFNSFEQSLCIDDQLQSNISSENLQIFSRFASIIYHLSNAWKNEYKVSEWFDKFYDILGILFNYGISNNDHMLIQNSSEALNQLIFNASPDLTPKLENLYKTTLDFLYQSRTQLLAPEIRFVVQSSFCSNISTLLLKLIRNFNYKNHQIIITHAGRTLELLYELLSNKDAYVNEEGLMAISALVNATSFGDDDFILFNQDTFNDLINKFIYNGLTSMNSGVINASCFLIGNLYYFQLRKFPELVQVIPDIFNALKNIILNNKDMRSVHPFILKAISDMFNSLNEVEGSIPDLEEELRDLLTKIYSISTELDISNKDDIEYGNMFYLYLANAFRGYAKLYYNKENLEKEREQLLLLDKLAYYIYMMSPRIDEQVYLAFARTATQFAENCSRRNGVILNRHSVHRILKNGLEESWSKDSKRKIKNAIDYIRKK